MKPYIGILVCFSSLSKKHNVLPCVFSSQAWLCVSDRCGFFSGPNSQMGDVLMLLYIFHEFVIGLDNMYRVHTCLAYLALFSYL